MPQSLTNMAAKELGFVLPVSQLQFKWAISAHGAGAVQALCPGRLHSIKLGWAFAALHAVLGMLTYAAQRKKDKKVALKYILTCEGWLETPDGKQLGGAL